MITTSPRRVFAALSDPTRQQLVDWMAAGETGTATEFAERLPISRQAVSRHLSELAGAGLTIGTRRGKEVRYSFDAAPLSDATKWLEARAELWEGVLGALAQHLSAD